MKNLERWQARQSLTEPNAWGIVVEGSLSKPNWIIHPTKDIDEQDAALIMATHNAAVEKRPERSITCSSITNSKLEPIVEIVMGPEVAHFHIREARQVIKHLQEASEAAISDALLTRFIRDHVYRGRDDNESRRAIGSMLVMFREFRSSMDEPLTTEAES